MPKPWERPLDKRTKGPGDPFTNHNPSYQIDFYLRATDRRWGLLTNGRHWRLYYRDLSYRLDVYYEVDLPQIVSLDEDAFLYFLAFFHKNAFEPDGTGQCFLDRAYKQSTEYATKVSEELRDNVYEALRLLAEGFLSFLGNNLKPQDLDLVRQNAFILVYRLLFIFYAEARDLLPVANASYLGTYSLRALSHEIATKEPFERNLSPATTGYWSRLSDLFRLIDGGDDFLHIPPYNGGLFDDKEHVVLTSWKIGDRHLAAAIDQLARATAAGRTGRGFVSYRDLSIRELGSIYEGLLEHHPRCATQDVAVIKEDKRETFVRLAELGSRKAIKTYPAGSIYLETDKGERKASGSYYTPQYIVEYIVQNTLGPLLEEAKKTGGNLIDAILNLKVLDPAMGSGHFLVESTDYLARALVEALGADPIEIREDEVRWARREVVERCIYGVDLNPLAVDLAKLSLWLSTVSLDKPLNFLDHHLRCGDSLVGARLEDMGQLPTSGKKASKGAPASQSLLEYYFHQNVATAVDNYFRIAEMSSDKLQDIQEKERLYGVARDILKRYLQVAHIWTGLYFGNEVLAQGYMALQDKIRAAEAEWEELEKQPWFARGVHIGEERRFLHWELEFPEVFFDRNGQRLPDAGFSAVVGNPPYDELSEMAAGGHLPEKDYFAELPRLSPALGGRVNLFRLFIVQALTITRKLGMQSYIVPLALLSDQFALHTRKLILQSAAVLRIENFPQKDDPKDRVFTDAKLSTTVYVLRKAAPPSPFTVRTHPGKHMEDSSPSCLIDPEDLRAFDPENLSVPQADQESWELAKRLAAAPHMTRLGDVCEAYPGEIMLNAQFRRYLSSVPTTDVLLRGAHIWRYEFNPDPKQGQPIYLRTDLYLRERGEAEKARHHDILRIAFQRGSAIDNWRRIIATMLDPGWFCTDTVGYLIPTGLTPFAILSLFNCKLSEWRFRLTSTNNHVSPYEIAVIPIRRINFTTPQGEREQLVAEGKSLYQDYLQSKDLAKALCFVSKCLPQEPDGKPDTEREQSDVVHDLLAFLAEEMTRLNREKQSEVKGFLTWLRSYLGVNVEDLKNKTRVKEYWKGDAWWEGFLSALEQNRKVIQSAKGVDVTRRASQEAIRAEFDASVAKLAPLLQRIEPTDRLIDQIVYKLYGLTEEEIRIVEGQEVHKAEESKLP